MEYFFIDERRNIRKTYNDLINDINLNGEFNKYIYERNVYKIFVDIISSLVIGESIELLDMDLSANELVTMGISSNDLAIKISNRNKKVKSYEHLLKIIEENKLNWKITMYTSGTTGRPKKITHQLSTLIRTVKISNKFSDNVWAFCYNPTHFAGMQVFFQALLNMNTIIYIFDNIQRELCKTLIDNNVTNISATPTFYRTNIFNFNDAIQSVRYVTLGGERFDKNLVDKLKDIFPNAKIRNIYASTEAGSIFSSDSDYFVIDKSFSEYIKIDAKGELLINEKLLGSSEELLIKDGWYHTGDIVELVDENKFKIISRNTEMINVGGYKVNPNEVEEEIKKIEGIIDVLITSRQNKLIGNVIVAEIVKSSDVDENELETIIINNLNVKLQKWKIPRIIKFVKEIDKTRTGKKVRR